MEDDRKAEGAEERRRQVTAVLLRLLLLLGLLAGLLMEAYYIVVLRGTIGRQTEDLRNISMELQTLRTDNAALREELNVMQGKRGGDDADEHTPDR